MISALKVHKRLLLSLLHNSLHRTQAGEVLRHRLGGLISVFAQLKTVNRMVVAPAMVARSLDSQ